MNLLSIEINNFKKFNNKTIIFKDEPLVICGCNGSGKTQLIWAILLFFRGHNLMFTDSKFIRDGNNIKQIQNEIHELLSPHLYNLSDFTSFSLIRDNKGYGESIFTGNFSIDENIHKLSVSLLSNGVLQLKNFEPENYRAKEKIKYAFMNNSFIFYKKEESLKDEHEPFPLKNSFSQNFRVMHAMLGDKYRKIIEKYMIELFNVKSIDQEVEDKKPYSIPIYISEKNHNNKLEIMFMGSAFQKIFTSLILLFNLICENGSLKFYLIEEPEALLYPSLVKKYYIIIKNICVENNIKLIITSNNDYIVHNSHNLFPLTTNSDEDHLHVTNYLGIYNTFKDLLLVEGSDEEGINGFITKLITLHPILNNFDIIAAKKFPVKGVLKNFMKVNDKKIIYLRDSEFLPYDRVKKHNKNVKLDKNNIYEIYTELPCSESYLILDYLLTNDKDNNKEILRNYFSINDNWKKYMSGLVTAVSNDKKPITNDENLLWVNARNEIEKENPNYKLIVSVIHGHSWVNMLKNSNLKNTKQWVKNTNFLELHDDVKNILNVTVEHISNICKL